MSSNNASISRTNLGPIRVSAIRAHKSGMAVNDIAKMLGLHRGSVSRWITNYRRAGAKVLRSKKSSGRPKKIDCIEFIPKLKKVISRPATAFGFENSLWNCSRIQEVITQELGYKISTTTVWRSLKDIGLSYQKPERRALEQDPKLRKIWIDKTWPNLLRKAKKQRAVILFQDESAVSLSPVLGKTWARIAQTPISKVTAKRGTISVISAISPTGRLYFTIPKGNVASGEFIKFMKQILREIPRKKIFMVVDNCSSHKSKKTTDFVDSIDRLDLVYLPSYSPDFNPDELTWAHLKNVKLKQHGARNKADLRRKTLGKMRSIQKNKPLVKSFVKKVYVT
jgi:transposase